MGGTWRSAPILLRDIGSVSLLRTGSFRPCRTLWQEHDLQCCGFWPFGPPIGSCAYSIASCIQTPPQKKSENPRKNVSVPSLQLCPVCLESDIKMPVCCVLVKSDESASCPPLVVAIPPRSLKSHRFTPFCPRPTYRSDNVPPPSAKVEEGRRDFLPPPIKVKMSIELPVHARQSCPFPQCLR